jgi:hypothetical protein
MMKRMLAVMAVVMAMLVALAWAVRAHQAPSGWAYPYECCAGHDCAAVASQAVVERRGGWQVTVAPGTHPQVPAGRPAVSDFVPVERARPSPDGEFHICLSPADLRVLCFFAPPGGV